MVMVPDEPFDVRVKGEGLTWSCAVLFTTNSACVIEGALFVALFAEIVTVDGDTGDVDAVN